VAEIDQHSYLLLVEEIVRQAIVDIEAGIKLIPMYKEKIVEIKRNIIIGDTDDSSDPYEMEVKLKRNKDLLREVTRNYKSAVLFFDSKWFEFILGSATSLTAVDWAREYVKKLTGKLPE